MAEVSLECEGIATGTQDRMNQQTLSVFIWSVADLLRGDYKQSEYGLVQIRGTLLEKPKRLEHLIAMAKTP